MTIGEFQQKQSLPYKAKVLHAEKRAWEFYDKVYGELNKNVHVSVGGLDSITLLVFLRSIGIKCPAISVQACECSENRAVHRQIGGIENIKPLMSMPQVLNQLGFPVISKAKANKIAYLQNKDSEKTTFIHAIMTGDMGEQGNFQHSDKIKLPDKWIQLFGGYYQEHRPDLLCRTATFKVSSQCCKYMKEEPCDKWAKENNSVPYLGLMASEGGQREMALMKNGCNYYGKNVIRSCPFAIFNRQDLLQLAIDLDVPVPASYGKIEKNCQGELYTTKAQRTGCPMCGFGIHIEKRPHRFDRMRESNPKMWDYFMNRCVTDESGTYGWGRVLDYIGVEWRDEYIDWDSQQMTLFE